MPRRHHTPPTNDRRRALVLVENLSVPFDRRVWQECTTLRHAGWDVHVICPQGTTRDTEPETEIDGVHIHRYPMHEATGGPAGYLHEYASALWHTLRLARRLAPVDIVHACNPPDLLFLVARMLRRRGARFVFDQEYPFGAPGNPRTWSLGRCGWLGFVRQEYFESGPMARLAGHLDPAIVLLNDPINRGQS